MKRTPEQAALAEIAVGLIRQQFAHHGTSMTQWARDHGYEPPNCSVILRRWAWRAQQRPHGGLARLVMTDLLTEFPALKRQLTTAALQRRASARLAA